MPEELLNKDLDATIILVDGKESKAKSATTLSPSSIIDPWDLPDFSVETTKWTSKQAGSILSDSSLIQNPVVALMIGVLATVLLQSSSSTTSIVVTMVSSGIIDVQPAIPIIMGANVGTSITNTIVSLGSSAKKDEFRRAFAAATVHDAFNWLTVFVLLPLEVLFGFLYKLTSFIIQNIEFKKSSSQKPPEMLKVLTKPLTNRIIQLDKSVIEDFAAASSLPSNFSSENLENVSSLLIKKWCSSLQSTATSDLRDSENFVKRRCSFLFAHIDIPEKTAGVLLLIISLLCLCGCLLGIVKIMHSSLKGQIALAIRKSINSSLPRPFHHLTPLLAMTVGAILTFLVQSSSIFTSALTPLVGVGVITLKNVYPLTLGSNIGTTSTGLFASLASTPDKLHDSLQIALCHLFFNVFGILMWYPIPAFRFPLCIAKCLGNTTAKFPWFAIFYLIILFLALPSFIFSLSLLGPIPFLCVFVPLIFLLFFVIIVSWMQRTCPKHIHPTFLRSWAFLPTFMHSLRPLDSLIKKVAFCFSFRKKMTTSKHSSVTSTTRTNPKDKQHLANDAPAALTTCETDV